MNLPNSQLTEEALEALGNSFRRCDFRGNAHREFLSCMDSIDVQAAPGSGKTTLLVAKLMHVRECWSGFDAGICVLSHTNAARREVQSKLGAAALMDLTAHPHFIGTVTGFVHRFISIPYLRGAGWPIRRIDNDYSDAVALGLVKSSGFLARQFRKQRQFQSFAMRLVVGDSVKPEAGLPTEGCPIRDIAKMPQVGTTTRNEFEKVKGALLRDGIYRYEDLTVLAHKALDACPILGERLRQRFPLVLLDEAQDTSVAHLEILERVFGDGIIQRLGDRNQTLYDSDAGWEVRDGAVDLGQSRRFTPSIAKFATKLAVRQPQEILGFGHDSTLPAVITYPRDEPSRALDAFACMVNEELPRGANAWVVGWVHRPTESQSAVSLQSYVPEYRPPNGPRASSDTLFELVSSACHIAKTGVDLAGPVQSVRRGLLGILRRQEVTAVAGIRSEREFRNWLKSTHPLVFGELNALLVAMLVTEVESFAMAECWNENRKRLLTLLQSLLMEEALNKRTREFLALPSEPRVGAQDVVGTQHKVVELANGTSVHLQLGSVAAVKGCTHDATMVVQTTMGRVKDVKTALEVAIGKRQASSLGTNLLRGVTNVFVGSTRPRSLLCLALPEEDLSQQMRTEIGEWGWRIVPVSG